MIVAVLAAWTRVAPRAGDWCAEGIGGLRGSAHGGSAPRAELRTEGSLCAPLQLPSRRACMPRRALSGHTVPCRAEGIGAHHTVDRTEGSCHAVRPERIAPRHTVLYTTSKGRRAQGICQGSAPYHVHSTKASVSGHFGVIYIHAIRERRSVLVRSPTSKFT